MAFIILEVRVEVKLNKIKTNDGIFDEAGSPQRFYPISPLGSLNFHQISSDLFPNRYILEPFENEPVSYCS